MGSIVGDHGILTEETGDPLRLIYMDLHAAANTHKKDLKHPNIPTSVRSYNEV